MRSNTRSALLGACALAGLTGCGPEDSREGIPVIEYRSGCLTFQAEQEINQERLDHNVDLARAVLAPIVGDKFCASFASLEIRIRSDVTWPCWGHETCYGQAWGVGVIHLSRTGGALAHELLHIWDGIHLTRNPHHVNWETNGYNHALDLYNVGLDGKGTHGWWRLNPQDYEQGDGQ